LPKPKIFGLTHHDYEHSNYTHKFNLIACFIWCPL